MAYLGKTFKHDKDENFDEFLKSLNLPAERVQSVKNFKPSVRLEKSGDTYTLYTSDDSGNKEISFKDGVEVDEPVAPGVVAKTTFTVDDNTLTQVQKYGESRTFTYKRVYSEDKLTMTISTSFWDGAAVRHYTAA